jgi:uncharacterized protein
MLFFAGLLAVVMGQVYTRQLTAIARREMHADDKGYLVTYPEAKKRLKDSTAGSDSFLDLLLQFAGLVIKELPFVSFCVLALLIRILVPAISSDGSGRIISGLVVIALTALVAVRSRALSKEIERREAARGVAGTILAALTAAVITMVRPVSDLWYYGGSVFVLLAILYSVFSLIGYYNLLVTDPVPHFFDRNAGDGTEKKYDAPPKKKKVRKGAVALPQPLVVIGTILLILAGAFILTEVTGFGSVPEGGRKTYENSSTGYFAYLSDEAELFSQEEEAKLEEEMIPITAYGNAAVVTARVIGQDTNEFAIDTYKSLFGGGVSGTIFLIDMGNRNIWICSDGEIYKTITKGYANIICDNVYRHATKGRYYQCASEALSQITVLLDGGKIARPMKLITSVLLALLLSCILNYWMVTVTLGVETPGAAELAGGVAGAAVVTDAVSKVTNTRRVYSPPSKSSGGGGGGFSGGGGGGGFSGGGGGHGF